MKAKTIQIYWHDKQPIYSVDSEPCFPGRLATCGADSNVRLWKIIDDPNGNPQIDFISNLSRHTASVNVVRWSPAGAVLASAGDDGAIILWKQVIHQHTNTACDETDEFNKETWKIQLLLRGSGADIYDIAWSPDASMILSGSIDNTVRVSCTKTGKCLQVLADHSHFVQGVAWDPLGKYLASQSSDRSVLVYSYEIGKNGVFRAKLLSKHSKLTVREPQTTPHASHKPQQDLQSIMPPPASPRKESQLSLATEPPSQSSPLLKKQTSSSAKSYRIYHDETLTSFFRRLTFLSDGSLLLTPASQIKSAPVGSLNQQVSKQTSEDFQNTVYVYARAHLESGPIAHLPGLKRPSIAIKCCPIKFKLNPVDSTRTSVFNLAYRLVYAVATQDSILVYDTQNPKPICVLSNLHYATFTDLTWSFDGLSLLMASTDGFCSMVCFEGGELGDALDSDKLLALQAGAESSIEKHSSSTVDSPCTALPFQSSQREQDPTLVFKDSPQTNVSAPTINDVSNLVRKKQKS